MQRFILEEQYSIMNCEIDGKYHSQFIIIILYSVVKMHVFRYSLSSFRCWCIFSGDMENQVEQEEKSRLINQVLELQHTLEGIKALFFFFFKCI